MGVNIQQQHSPHVYAAANSFGSDSNTCHNCRWTVMTGLKVTKDSNDWVPKWLHVGVNAYDSHLVRATTPAKILKSSSQQDLLSKKIMAVVLFVNLWNWSCQWVNPSSERHLAGDFLESKMFTAVNNNAINAKTMAEEEKPQSDIFGKKKVKWMSNTDKNSSGGEIANENLLLHSCRWKFMYIFKHFYTMRRESYRSRSRSCGSPILVPIESSYITSY